MMTITESIEKIKNEIGEKVTLVAVSKTKPVDDILSAYNSGQREFGENKVQELVEKYEKLPKDINWHFIGHLQRNKVKFLTPFVDMIHSVDSVKLLKEIDKRASTDKRIVNCLLQLSIADEESKFGFEEGELLSLIETGKYKEFSNVRICGLMGMATNTVDENKIQGEFAHLRKVFDNVHGTLDSEHFKILSMGMTSDYAIAVKEGSNMVRIGSLIFGERSYH